MHKLGQMELQNSIYGSSNIGVFSVTFMKCRHGNVDMRRNHGKVVIGRDVPFLAIKHAPYCMRLEGKMIAKIHYKGNS